MMSNDFKEKYEDLELKYNNFVSQTKQDTLNYESLQNDYAISLNKNIELENRLKEVESKLANLEDAIEPAINDFKELNTKLEIEQQCRTEAEIYASKIVNNNKKLKRESQLILQYLKPNVSLPPLEALMAEDAENDDTSSEELTKLKKQYDKSQIELEKVRAQLLESQRRLNEYEQAIEPAIAEYEELSNKLVIEQKCKTEAANYAQKVVLDNKKLKRQSQMLLMNLKPDFNLKDIDIILENDHDQNNNTKDHKENIDKLNKQITELDAKLSESSTREAQLNDKVIKLNSDNSQLRGKIILLEKNENQFEKVNNELTLLKERLQKENIIKEQIEQLAEKENATDESKSLVESLKLDLKISAEEGARLQVRVLELEKWKTDSELEISDLKSKLEIALAPPPPPMPPPPPPPPSAAPLSIFKISKLRNGLTQNPDSAVSEQNNKLMDEMKKMMDRIKKGGTIKNISIEKTIISQSKKKKVPTATLR